MHYKIKNISLIVLSVLTLLIVSCEEKSELDFERDPTFVKLDNDTIVTRPDSIGVPLLFGEKYFVLSRKEQRMLYYARANDIYSFQGVAIPESDNLSREVFGDSVRSVIFDCSNSNTFFGFPSAVEVDGEALLIGQRKTSESTSNDYSDNFMMQKDANDNWQQTDLFKYAAYGREFLTSKAIIGKTGGGQIVIKAKGLLVSDGNTNDWTHYPYAFSELIDSGKTYANCGSSMAFSSKFGLFFGTGQVVNKSEETKGCIISVDPSTGTAKEVVDSWVPQIKSYSGALKDMAIIEDISFISIEHPDLAAYKYDVVGFGISKDKVYQFVYQYEEGDVIDSLNFAVELTNVEGSFVRHSPVNVSYNPVTKRFEMIHSSPYYLELYSISPEDMLSNKIGRLGTVDWRKDAILLTREVSVRGQGMYPVSSIIDEDEGVQRVYISMGDEYPSRSGMFELTRILDTDKLADFVENRRYILQNQDF